ncbi:MAG TPA: hypothetical protein H9920_09570 [Candidatus Alistipes faecavium]|nr:hypothetical protein [Candidatus Alistipes faecavium]
MDIKQLIEETITDLINNKSLESVFGKVQVIAKSLKNNTLSQWVDCELINGYGEDDVVPEYRQVHIAEIKADYIAPHGFGALQVVTSQRVPIENLGRERYEQIAIISLREPITSLQQAYKPDHDVHYSLTPFEMNEVQKVLGNRQIMQAYKVISNQDLLKIINKAKSKLIDVFMEFNDTIFNGDLNIHSSNNADRIQKIVINAGLVQTGDGTINVHESNVLGGKNQDISISSGSKAQIADILNRIEQLSNEVDEDRTDIAEAILTIREELSKPTPQSKVLKMGFSFIKKIASSFVDKSMEVLADKGISYLIES